MNSSELKDVISVDIEAFYLRSISLENTDAWLNQYGYRNFKDVRNGVRQNPLLLNLINSFISNYYLLKDEYIVCCSNTMLLTNYRLLLMQGQSIFAIELNKVLSYEPVGNSLVVTYLEGDSEKKYYANEWIIESYVNNALQKHVRDFALLSPVHLDVISLTKQDVSRKYNYLDTTTYTPDKPIKQTNYRGILAVCVFVAFFGGCFYLINSNDKPIDYEAMEQRNRNNHVGEVKCDWCGGIGKVGYSGQSEAQVKRTGMGLGNQCISCKGTGYVKK